MTQSPGRTRRAVLLALVAVLSVLGLAAPPAAHARAVQWYDGSIAYSTVINCPSMIQGNPYTEYGLGTFVGQTADSETSEPKTGQAFALHIYIAGMGMPCSGGSVVLPKFNLPDGFAFAKNLPIYCFKNGNQGGAAPNQLCGGWNRMGSDGTFYAPDDAPSSPGFEIVQGATFEIQVPVVSTKAHAGTPWSVSLQVADGNDNPTLHPSANAYVFQAPKQDPGLRAWAADTTVARSKPAVLKASLAAGATGKVVFKHKATGNRLCVATISAGRASCKTAATLKPGKYAIVASYAGDANWLADKATFSFTKLRR